MSKPAKIAMWFFSVFSILAGVAFFPSFASFLFLAAGILLLPLEFLSDIFDSISINGWKKWLAFAIVFIAACNFAPTKDAKTEKDTSEDVTITQETNGAVDRSMTIDNDDLGDTTTVIPFVRSNPDKDGTENETVEAELSAAPEHTDASIQTPVPTSELTQISTPSPTPNPTLSPTPTPTPTLTPTPSPTPTPTPEITRGGADDKKITYVLNTSTKKFHYPSCRDVAKIKSSNRKDVTWDRAKVISNGYDPCGHCNP